MILIGEKKKHNFMLENFYFFRLFVSFHVAILAILHLGLLKMFLPSTDMILCKTQFHRFVLLFLQCPIIPNMVFKFLSLTFSFHSSYYFHFSEVKLFALCSLIFVRCTLLVTFCLLLLTFCSLLITFCLLLVTFCSLLVTFYSLLVTFCSLLVNFCSLRVTFWSIVCFESVI